MIKHQAFKFQLRPDGAQEYKMRQFAGSCRFVYNRALAQQLANYKAGIKHASYEDTCTWLVAWKQDVKTAWLKAAPAQPLQQSLKHLTQAFTNFFEKQAKPPRFKKRGRHDSFTYPQSVKLEEDNKRVYLPKLGWMRLRLSRKVMGDIKNVTVSCKAGKWYAAIQTEMEVGKPVHPSASVIGLDVGIARLVTLSDSTVFKPANSYKKHQTKLAELQRQLALKVRFSKNWYKIHRKLQKLHVRIINIRNDYLHKISSTLSKNHAMVAMERLKIENMVKSAKGTVAVPGRNVRAKSGLNRAILDQGWGELFRQIAYKLGWRGGKVALVNPVFTSQRCSDCGYTNKANRLTQAHFQCQSCGMENNADVNAARNILAAALIGHSAIA